MGMKAGRWAAAAAVALGLAEGAAAGGFAPVGTIVSTVPSPVVVAPGAAAPERTPLEWLRYVGPRMGRNVAVPVNGVLVPGIEWHHDVQVRVRTESGAALTLAERASIRAQALVCRRGEVRGPTEVVEPNGTLVIDYDCAWLQGAQ